MGWKNLKERFRIEHTVHVREGGICIGSAYVSDLITVGMDGRVAKVSSIVRINDPDSDLARYLRDLNADPEGARDAIQTPDQFVRSLPVYTYEGSRIIEKQCESLGWPNITHDGELMYENSFSADKSLVVKWAKRNAAAGVELTQRRIKETNEKLVELEAWLAADQHTLAELEAAYPQKPATEDAR